MRKFYVLIGAMLCISAFAGDNIEPDATRHALEAVGCDPESIEIVGYDQAACRGELVAGFDTGPMFRTRYRARCPAKFMDSGVYCLELMSGRGMFVYDAPGAWDEQ